MLTLCCCARVQEFYTKNAKTGKQTVKFHAMVTTYEMIIQESAALKQFHWDLLVVDEGITALLCVMVCVSVCIFACVYVCMIILSLWLIKSLARVCVVFVDYYVSWH